MEQASPKPLKYEVLPHRAYTLPYIGVDLSNEPWEKVIEILTNQAQSYKIFLENANFGFEWANECNKFMIEEFNRKTLNSIEIYRTEMQGKLESSLFKKPEVPLKRPLTQASSSFPTKRIRTQWAKDFECECNFCQ